METLAMEIKLTDDETQLLKAILSKMAIQDHSAVLGFMHGLNRFVSLDIPLRKAEKAALDDLVKKFKVGDSIKRIKK